MKVTVIGASGQLGTDLVKVLSRHTDYQVLAVDHDRMDVTDSEAVRKVLLDERPDVVVNAAAFTHVDNCEDQPDEAYQVNAVGALYVARACAEIETQCVYSSTDYVFGGDKGSPYDEHDTPRPLNVYGASKLAGEYSVRQACPQWLVVRVASLFGKVGARGKGGNFVAAILTRAKSGQPLQVVNDVFMSPTYTLDAAQGLEQLIRDKASGLVHLTNEGSCSWHTFAAKAVESVGYDATVAEIAASEYPYIAVRPLNSSLVSRTQTIAVRSWADALTAYLIEKGYLN